MYIVAVFFNDSKGNGRKYRLDRPYFYVIRNEMYRVLDEQESAFTMRQMATLVPGYRRKTYHITNGSGFQYNDARVIIVPISFYSDARPLPSGIKLLENCVPSEALFTPDQLDCAIIDSAIKNSEWLTTLDMTYVSGLSTELANTLSVYSSGLVDTLSAPNNSIIKKEDSNMFDNMLKNFKFGPIDNGSVRMSMLGLAIASKDRTYVAYDARTDSFVDATDFLLDGCNDFIYAIPVAVKDVAPGDYIFHGATPVRVVEVLENGNISAQNITEREAVTVIPVRNVFGFNFYSKVVSLVGNMFGGADDSQPFGNMLPLLFMKNGSGSKDNLAMLLAMGSMKGMGSMNPMLMMALMNKSDNNSMLPLMLMSQNGQNSLGNLFSGFMTTGKTAETPVVTTTASTK